MPDAFPQCSWFLPPAARIRVWNAAGVRFGVEQSPTGGSILVFETVPMDVTKIAAVQAVIEGKYLTNQVLTITL